MNFLVACCFAVVLLQFVAAEEKEYYTGLIIPEEDVIPDLPEGVYLLTEEIINQPASKNKNEEVVSMVEYNEPNVELFLIHTKPLDSDTQQSVDELIEGGVGTNFAVVRVTSQPGKGNYFSVRFYGKYLDNGNVEGGASEV